MRALRQRLTNRIKGIEDKPFSWEQSASNDFEKVDDYAFHLGSYSYSNKKSCVCGYINSKKPISGKKDFRVDFDMYNETNDPETGACEQWTFVGASFGKNREVDFTVDNIVGVRYKVVSDKKRSIWTSIGSNAYSSGDGSCRYGWFTEIGDTVSTIELYFKDSSFPFWIQKPPKDKVRDILKKVINISFSPRVAGCQENGVVLLKILMVSFILEHRGRRLKSESLHPKLLL